MGEAVSKETLGYWDTFNRIVQKAGLDDREQQVVAYRIGAKEPMLSYGDIANVWGVRRQRVHQIFEKAKEKINKISSTDWEKLEGTYRPNRPIAASRNKLMEQTRRLREYLEGVSASDVIQYGKILDSLGIPFDKAEDAYSLDEIQSCQRFFEVFGLRHFGKYRICTKCNMVKPLDDAAGRPVFYAINGDPEKRYATCRECNTLRCRDYTKAHAETVNARRREWQRRRASSQDVTANV